MARPWGCFFISGKVSFWPKVPVQEPRTSGVFFGVPGMTHRPQFQAKPGAIWSAVTGRKDDANKARALPESGVSEGSMRQNPCT